jgi:hypothetical protein
VTGNAFGCLNTNPLYEFWLLPPSGGWQLAQAYSPSAVFKWDTTGKGGGTYRFSVWAKDAASGASYDAWDASLYYTINTKACTSLGVTASPASPVMAGTAVTITGVAATCPNPSYEFWILYPGAGSWQTAQAYSPAAAFNWDTTGKPAGTYRFSVWVKDATSAAPYDAWNAGQYFTLTTGCSSLAVTSSPPSSAAAGTAVAITGTASGCLHAGPLYEFWVLYPGSGTWTLAQAYSTSATLSWKTAGLPPGAYRFSVWVKDAGSGAAYDAWNADLYYTLT